MARDKLITIRIEGEKRDAFNQLAKSQNTDTASLLYDFINQCLDGRIDISLVTGKGQRIDNQLDNDRLNKIDNRIDGIETTTQRLAKRLDDWIDAIDDRLTDCDQGLSEKIIALEHRINALSSQLDSQEIDDMDPLLKLQREASIATSPLPPSPSLPPDKLGEGGNGDIFPDSPPSPPDQPAIEEIKKKITLPDTSIVYPIGIVETVEPDSTIDTESGAIETLPNDNPPTDEPVKQNVTNKKIASVLGIDSSNLSKWLKTGIIPEKYTNKCQFNHDKTKIVLL